MARGGGGGGGLILVLSLVLLMLCFGFQRFSFKKAEASVAVTLSGKRAKMAQIVCTHAQTDLHHFMLAYDIKRFSQDGGFINYLL